MSNRDLGILDTTDESWWIEKSEIQATRLDAGKSINETPMSMLVNFNTGRRRYQVYVIYDPRGGIGRIRLNVDPIAK